MKLPNFIRESKLLRRPLLAASKGLFSLLRSGPPSLLWMDIEGYEGHALAGAKSLLSSGIPLVSEFNPEFLAKAGGLEAFKHALEGRRIFDLQEGGQSPTTLTDITRRLSVKEKDLQWTDILAIN